MTGVDPQPALRPDLQPEPQRGALAQWGDDVRASLRAWRLEPLLPLVALGIGALEFSPAAFGTGTSSAAGSGASTIVTLLVVLPVTLYSVGFAGFERWLYAQLFTGVRPGRGHFWHGPWAYLGRFFVLALLMLAFSVPFSISWIVLVFEHHAGIGYSVEIVSTVLLDIGLTFVTPALAFHAPTATSAIRVGLSVLWRHRRRDWPYALFPPLAFTLIGRITPAAVDRLWLDALLVVGGQLLLVLFGGVNARAYLRLTAERDPWRAMYLDRDVRPAGASSLRIDRPGPPPGGNLRM